jgi:4-hydroxy-tetrahydrodipicolinate synthase
MNTKLYGTGVALVTPFTVNQEVDFEGLRRLIDHVTQGGVDYLVVMGTTGESATLSEEEKKQVLTFVKEHNTGKLPIVYGIGSNHTQQVLETIRKTDFTGVDAILSVSPYYNKPSQKGIVEHFKAIADACPVPVILYNVPGRTQSNMTAETTLKLALHRNIIGIKEASGDLVQCMEIARRKPEDFLLISGDDLLTLPMISFGAKGVISVLANAFPITFSRMVNEAMAGNYPASSQHLFQLVGINPLMYTESNPVGVKQALHCLGVCENMVRLPLLPASEELVQKISNEIVLSQLQPMVA